MGVLVGLLCAATWATSSILMRTLARKLDPFTLNAPRSLIGGLAMFLFAMATGRSTAYQTLTTEKLFFLLASVSIGGGIGDTLYVSSLARIGVSRAFPIASTYPALTLVFGLVFLQERADLIVVGGLALVLVGILVISRPAQPLSQHPTALSSTPGIVFALFASVCWAASGILVAPGIKGLDPIMVSSIRTPALSLVLFGIVALRRSYPALFKLSRAEWGNMVAGGLVGWGLGSVLFLWTVALVGPTRAAILTSTSPLFALPLSVILLRERISRAVLGGTLLTVLGVILVSQ